MADRTIVEWTGTFKMDEGLGFFTYGDIVDHEGNIYEGPLTFDQAYSVPGFDIESTTGVTEINFTNLIAIDPNNTQNGFIWITGHIALISVSAPNLVTLSGDINIRNNPAITSIDLSSLTSFGVSIHLDNSPFLTEVDLSSLIPSNGQTLTFSNCALDATNVNAILARCVSNAGFVTGTVNLTGGTNSAPTGQGITDSGILLGRGVDVTTN